MSLFYSFKIERHEGKGFYCGLGATDDPAADAPAKSYAGWSMFPWNGGTAPTEAQLKADFTVLQKDGKGDDIPASSVKHTLDAQLGVAPTVVSDATPKATVKNAKGEDVPVPKSVLFAS